jgi:hypothetical protein
MHTLRPRVIGRVLLALLVGTGCRASIATPPCADRGAVNCTTDGIRVLFIGNSLTYGNDVPAIVRALAVQHGGPPLRTTTVAFPNMSLDDHWRDGTARRALPAGTVFPSREPCAADRRLRAVCSCDPRRWCTGDTVRGVAGHDTTR